MKEELVNLHAGLCTLWVDHALLEPEIPRNSLVLVAPTRAFKTDGMYVLRRNKRDAIYRCSGLGAIAVSHNEPKSLVALTNKEFDKVVKGRVIGHLKIEL